MRLLFRRPTVPSLASGIRRRLSLGIITGKTTSLPPRLSFFFIALVFQIWAESLYWVFGRQGNLFVIVLSLGLWLVWFALIFLMALPKLDRLLRRYRRRLHQCVVAIVILLAVMGITELVGLHALRAGVVKDIALADEVAGSIRYNDATAFNHQASESLLKGENPYTQADILAALEDRDLPATTVTPLMQGDFAEVFPTPLRLSSMRLLMRPRPQVMASLWSLSPR